MILYLTFNDPPSGIYSSQVIDTVKFLRDLKQNDVRLVAFISLRKFKKNRRTIRKDLPDAIVLPMFPGVHRWKNNSMLLKLLCLYLNPSVIIGRSVLATSLAFLTAKTSKIIYDGRGAIAAEWKEYKVVGHERLLQEIHLLEKDCVNKSDFRIAVSAQLVEYWGKEYGYHNQAHVVIPCTLNKLFESLVIDRKTIAEARSLIGFSEEHVIFVYSGSVSGWQSFHLLERLMRQMFSNDKSRLLFLSGKDSKIEQLAREFPGRIFQKNVSPAQVPHYLIAGDYGILVREQSVTNKVASPVKFAEYLACGLSVIISENLGDFTGFVKRNSCGHILSETSVSFVPVVRWLDQRQYCRELALSHFSKNADANRVAFNTLAAVDTGKQA